jgi:membrane protease YdiL (CAAX protease family)
VSQSNALPAPHFAALSPALSQSEAVGSAYKSAGAVFLKTLAIVALALVIPVAVVIPLQAYLPGDLTVMAASPALLAVLLTMQLVMGLGALALARSATPSMSAHMAFAPPRQGWKAYVIAIVAGLAISIGVNLIRQHVFGHDVHADLRQMAPMFKNPLWPLSFLVFAIAAPLGEELLFRGYLLGGFRQSRLLFIFGVLLSTLIWVALHSYSTGGMILVAVLGAVFAAMRYWTGSLRVPVAAHIFNNTLCALILQFGPPV